MTYQYDATGGRRSERLPNGTTKLYIWDGQQVVAHGGASSLTVDIPGDDIDSHIVSVDTFGAGSRWYYHQGPDQSTLAVTGSSGLIEGYSYSGFGQTTIWNTTGGTKASSTFGNLFLFQGQVYDSGTGTYAMRARQYQPKWGRFLSPDPLGYQAGPSLYSFTGGKPLHSRDPLGLMQVVFCIDQGSCLLGFGGTPITVRYFRPRQRLLIHCRFQQPV